MSDATLARDLRNVLNAEGMNDQTINTAIQGELKEAQIAQTYPGVVASINNNQAGFSASLNTSLTASGATWNGVVYNLTALGLSMGIKLVATEELSAIRTHANTPGFDSAKALTNMLRIIKAAER